MKAFTSLRSLLVSLIVTTETHWDVSRTRNHYYRRWILFYDVNHPALATRTVVGQECCDLAIKIGKATPIQKRHNSIADAMNHISSLHAEISRKFHKIIAEPEHHMSGWYDFLLIAFYHYAYMYLHQHGATNTTLDDVQANIPADVLEGWQSWFITDCKPSEMNCGSFGSKFRVAADNTPRVVEDLFDRWL